ncbi:hypothetical protein [Halococcus salsus]|uniref:hypothetical protein n=1 Tax=Halococcus salsus TaxID=2162894 RepID=UPI00135A9373|nr:hypothetical protein [Halococcus salsus]
MPFTLFHLGPALLFAILLFRWLDFPAFLAANVIVDIRAILVFFGYLNGRLHGPLHTFMLGALLALILSVSVYFAKPVLNRTLGPFQLEQDRAWQPIVTAAITGVFLHICLDSMLYTDIQPFYPTSFNPFFGLLSVFNVYTLCVVAFALSMIAYGGRLFLLRIPSDN